jgi:hypothetical protein
MTTINVPLSEPAQQQLRRRAAEEGMPLEEFARTVLEREAAAMLPEKTAEEWIAEWRAWTSSRPKRDLTMDDSRESIYQGRE